ncbi:MAG: hypothetical protein ACE3JP_05465 [Ectobacillus sp.]
MALAAGIGAAEIADLYSQQTKRIFGKKRALFGIRKSKYSNEPLQQFLFEKFGGKRITESNVMLCIPSIEHSKAEPKVYKTPHHKEYIIDGQRYMGEAALATSAAPTFFPPAMVG